MRQISANPGVAGAILLAAIYRGDAVGVVASWASLAVTGWQ